MLLDPMKSMAYILALSITMSFLACSSTTDSKQEAETTMAKVYDLIQEEAYESVLDYYSPQFFQETSREKWNEMLENINSRLGSFMTYEVIGWKVKKNIGTGSGTYVQLTYETNYKKYVAQENIILFREVGTSNFSILGHHIVSKGFL